MPKVSIILPIYNAEQYLRPCIESVLNQSLTDIEILCIDDGSQDSSVDIIKEYMQYDHRIRIISKPNAGYGHSLNLGIRELTGDYFGIVEADDCITSDMYETLFNYATVHNLDFVRSDHYRWFPKRENKKLEYCYSSPDLYRTVICPFEAGVLFPRVVTCAGLYKTTFVRSNNIVYNETPGAAFQDQGFWFQTTALAKRMMFIDKAFYYYRFDNQSSSINSNRAVLMMNNEYESIKKFAYAHLNISDQMMAFYWRARFAMTLFSCRQMGRYITSDSIFPIYQAFKSAVETGEIDTSLFTDQQLADLNLLVEDVDRFCQLQRYNSSLKQVSPNKHTNLLKKLWLHFRTYGLTLTMKKILLKIKRK